ncbi:SLBB domain-containing protein [Candidatus Uabimicrobium sp. HlEnr_7]|uniref:SLBB domain-containing protein n=1 Tax=Candidatus Uabimicrobium helgolandensis TaxID=3095367 RepID=UPI003558B0F6
MLFFNSKLCLLFCLLIFLTNGCENSTIVADKSTLQKIAEQKKEEEVKRLEAERREKERLEAERQEAERLAKAKKKQQEPTENTDKISEPIRAMRIPDLNLNVEARFIPGDKIKIELSEEDEMVREFTISNKGVISYPYVEKIEVVDRTVSELEDELVRKLKKYYKRPVINISVLNWAERRVYLYGVDEGKNSVLLTPTKGMTASQLLISAGVSPKRADFNRISLTRRVNGKQKIIAIPLQELLEKYDIRKDVVLQPNDLILVKEAPKIHVQGNVRSPGSFPLQKNQKMNLLYALSLAEGTTEDADVDNIKIIRQEENGHKVIVVSSSTQSEMISLEPDDIIVVPSQNENIVTVYGEVEKPGTVRIVGRSVRLSTVIANAGGLTQYASHSIRVFRYFENGKTKKFSIDFDAITSGDSTQDIEMESGDVVYCDYGLW